MTMTDCYITLDLLPRLKPKIAKRSRKNSKRCANRRDLPETRRAGRVAGARSGRANGNRSIRKLLSTLRTILSPAADSVKAQKFCGGAKTRRRSNAHSIKSKAAKGNRSRFCDQSELSSNFIFTS